jgi:hypothetical protein
MPDIIEEGAAIFSTFTLPVPEKTPRVQQNAPSLSHKDL